MEIITYITAAVAAYLLGSIPTGYLVGKAKGIDIREHGSKNMGATNVFRVLGKGPGIFTLVIDFLKGFLACWLFPIAVMKIFGVEAGIGASANLEKLQFGFNATTSAQVQETMEWLRIVAGVAAILGHNYTCWLKFKGGKGVATTAGVLAALFPGTFGIALAIWIVVFAVSKYVSLASIAGAASLPVSTWLLKGSTRMIVLACFLGALAIYKHKSNIQRLLNGTENRFGKKKEEAAK